MAAPRTVELKRRIADASTSLDQRLEAVTDRIDQVENDSSGHFVQMREFIFDSFRTAHGELTEGLSAVRTDLRAEMADGFTAGRAEMTPRLDRIERKLDRLLTTRPSRVRRSKRGR
jgi:hypothetical protein